MSLEQAIFEIWRSSWQAAALVVLVLVVQWACGNRLPPRWRYNLWLIVVLRLLLPVLPQSSFSLFNLVHRAPAMVRMAVPAAPAMKRSETPAPRAIPAEAETTASSVDAPAQSEASTPVIPEVSNSVATPRSQPKSVPGARKQPRSSMRDWPWLFIGFATWLAGIVVLGMRVGWITLWTFRKARQATPVEDPSVLGLLAVCQAQMGVSRTLRVLETPMLQSPALFGLFRPVLLLPPGFTRKFSPAELRHVFLHELAHVVRRDLVWSWLLTLLQIVHWFNPAIWFGFSRMRADRELACDALALTRSGEGEAKPYGATIIKLLESMARPAGSMPFVGILENRNQMTRRIRMIAAFRPGRRWSLLAILLMGALCVTGLTDAIHISAAKTRIRVVDLATGLPLAGVSVYEPYSENINYSATPDAKVTDKDGWVDVSQQNFSRGFGVFLNHPDFAPAALTNNWYRSVNAPPRPKVPPLTEATVSLRRGRTLGGVVQDSAGRPLAGVRVELRGLYSPTRDTDETTPIQYPACHPVMIVAPVTDGNGVWNYPHFPDELMKVQIDFIRPEGSSTSFHTPFEDGLLEPANAKLDMQEFRIGRIATTLPDGVAVRGRVIDASGQPLAGVTVTERDRRRPQSAFTVRTDGAGRFELPQRDPHQVLLSVTEPSRAIATEVVNIAPGMPEVEIRVLPEAPLIIRVQDAAGKPVANVNVAPSEWSLGWNSQTDAQGRVSWDAAPRTPVEYQVYAEGYKFRYMTLTATGAEQVVTLVPGSAQAGIDPDWMNPKQDPGPTLPAFEGTLSLPDGRPAANAIVSLYDPAKHKDRLTYVELYADMSPRMEAHDGQTLLRADASGRLALPALSAQSEFVIVHKDGYRIISGSEWRQEPKMQLVAWSRVEGTATMNGEPLAKQRLSAQSKSDSFSKGLFLRNGDVSTDAQGRFECLLPAGRYNLYRTFPSEGQWPQSNPLVIQVKVGETTSASYEVSGRTVVGKLRTTPADVDFDWAKNQGAFLLKRVPARPRWPEFNDFVRQADYRKAYLERSSKQASIFVDTYGGTIEPDGSFRFENVPDGEFELAVEATKIENRQRQELGTLNRPVTIGARSSASEQDLGVVDFQFKNEALPIKPALDFEAVDSEGRPMRLSDLRGKYVLLQFWASWAPPTDEKLELLKGLAESAGGNQPFVIVNVSLDNDQGTARAWADGHGLPGLQCRLEGRARSSVTEAFQIDELPTTLFLGTDGRVRVRALPDARWRNTVLKALNP